MVTSSHPSKVAAVHTVDLIDMWSIEGRLLAIIHNRIRIEILFRLHQGNLGDVTRHVVFKSME